MRELTHCSFPDIGHRFGGRDHTTVMYAVKKIGKKLPDDVSLRNTVDALRKKIEDNSVEKGRGGCCPQAAGPAFIIHPGSPTGDRRDPPRCAPLLHSFHIPYYDYGFI